MARQYIFVGDSLTFGVGTTGTGSSGSNTVGNNIYPKQTFAVLNDATASLVVRGYPGQSAAGYASSQLNNDLALIDKTREVVVIILFGANDMIQGISGNQIYNNIRAVHQAYRNAGAKTITVPFTSRKDTNNWDIPGNENIRTTANNLLISNYAAFSDGLARVDQESLMYAANAPDNATYFALNDADGLSKVHWTDAGAALVAAKVKDAILSLSQGLVIKRGSVILA